MVLPPSRPGGRPSGTAPSRPCGGSTWPWYPGEVFALFGPNGAGKTTLLRILAAYGVAALGLVGYLGSVRRRTKALTAQLAALRRQAKEGVS